MSSPSQLDPNEVYNRGLCDPKSLTPAERLVYLILELETYAAMEGWDHFFTSSKLPYYPELKAGLLAAEDHASLEVLADYEQYLAAHGVPLDADAIDDFLCSLDDNDLNTSRDWRDDFSRLCPARWEKIKSHLLEHGIELLT